MKGDLLCVLSAGMGEFVVIVKEMSDVAAFSSHPVLDRGCSLPSRVSQRQTVRSMLPVANVPFADH